MHYSNFIKEIWILPYLNTRVEMIEDVIVLQRPMPIVVEVDSNLLATMDPVPPQ